MTSTLLLHQSQKQSILIIASTVLLWPTHAISSHRQHGHLKSILFQCTGAVKSNWNTISEIHRNSFFWKRSGCIAVHLKESFLIDKASCKPVMASIKPVRKIFCDNHKSLFQLLMTAPVLAQSESSLQCKYQAYLFHTGIMSFEASAHIMIMPAS